MRRKLFASCLVLVSALLFAGCCTEGAALAPAAAAAPCAVAYAPVAAPAPVALAPVAAAPCEPPKVQVQVVAAPQLLASGQQYVQVVYRTEAGSMVRAGLEIPGNLVVCVGNFLRCAMSALFPVVQPTASYVPVAAPAPAPARAAAPPCEPAPAAGHYVWVPAAAAPPPPPPPPAAAPADPCVPKAQPEPAVSLVLGPDGKPVVCEGVQCWLPPPAGLGK